MTDEAYLTVTLADLSRRRAQVHHIENEAFHHQIEATQHQNEARTVMATVPLSELLGYSTALRTITSGTASFSMSVSSYRHMTAEEQNKAVEKITGFIF